jgi:branched-chain amino acid transport system substrate-binding protein
VIQAWASYTNAHGGINGHPVKVDLIDDGGDPAKSLQAAKTLVETDKVMAIVGMQSLQDGAWQKYVESKGVPVVGGLSLEPTYLTSPDFFASGTTLPVMLYGILAQAKAAGKSKMGVFVCAESPVCASLIPILTGLGKLVGVSVTGQAISSTAPSYTAPCLAMQGKGVDSMFIGLSATLVPQIVAQCAQQGFKPLQVASSGTTERAWTSQSALDGTDVSATYAVYTDQSIPGVKKFLDAMNQYVPGLTSSAQFSYPLIGPWAGGELFIDAAVKAKLTPSSTPADVKKGLYALKADTLEGIAPPLTYTPGKPSFPLCYFPAKITGGAFQPVGSGAPTCVSPTTAAGIGKALGG